jgi:hypothetical protein
MLEFVGEAVSPFSGQAQAPGRVPYFTTKRIQFRADGSPPAIEPNPTLCVGCHRTPRSPNWNAYNLWPGVYGCGARGETESEGFANFLAQSAHQGRYQKLKELGPGGRA